MIHWTLTAVTEFEDVTVGTDSPEIKQYVEQYGVKVYDREPVRDEQQSEEAVLEITAESGMEDFILLQCTSPLITPHDIFGAVDLYMQGYDSVISGVMQERRIWDRHRQYTEPHKIPTYIMNGAIMISSVATIRRFDSIAGGRCGFYQMSLDTYYDIDTQEEFEICEALLGRRLHEG
jgi:CMP-N-acetylneuraminic acid synthetase